MPAEIITSAFCADYDAIFHVPGSKPGTHWTVQTDGLQIYCDCPAYKFAPEANKHCKHADYVFAHACLWNPQWYDGGDRTIRPTHVTTRTLASGSCPRCGGPVIPMRIAV
jgi:hypothetical protein